MKTKNGSNHTATKTAPAGRTATKPAANPSSSKQNGKTQGSSSDGKIRASSDAAKGLNSLFEASLKDIYWAEKALTKAIPKLIKNASSEDLVDALTDHLEVTRNQVTRLEEVFEMLGKPARAKKCEAMEGLIKEAESIMEETEAGVVRDAGIIAAGQKVEHYEIATYGTLCAFAKILGENEAVGLLQQTLEEEKQADEKLTEVAENTINVSAASEEDDDEEKDDNLQ